MATFIYVKAFASAKPVRKLLGQKNNLINSPQASLSYCDSK